MSAATYSWSLVPYTPLSIPTPALQPDLALQLTLALSLLATRPQATSLCRRRVLWPTAPRPPAPPWAPAWTRTRLRATSPSAPGFLARAWGPPPAALHGLLEGEPEPELRGDFA